MWRAVSVLSLLLLSGVGGCKNFFTPTNGTGGTTVVNTGDYAYCVNTAVNSISGFSVGSTGALTALSGFPFSLPFVPTTIVITPSNGLLYVAGAGVIYGYTITSAGALTQILSSTNSQALVNADIVSMDVTSDGKWLIALDATAAAPTIDYYEIGSTGQLTVGATIVQYPLQGTATIVPNSIRVDPTHTLVAASLGTAGDVIFRFDTTTGEFTPEIQVNTGSVSAADQAITFDSTTSTLYIARSGTGEGIYPYLIGSSNGNTTLSDVAGAPFALGPSTSTTVFGPSSMVIDKTGTYLYVGNKTASSLSGFTIGAGSVLTAITGSPFPTGTNIDALALDSSGKYVLSTNLEGNPDDIDLFSFDATTAGALILTTKASTGDTAEPAGAVAIALTH